MLPKRQRAARPQVGHGALLLHRGHGPQHYDLLVAAGSACQTWQLRALPGGALGLRPAPLHRRFYLDYSGPVGGGRGRVWCCWKGRLQIHVDRRGDGLVRCSGGPAWRVHRWRPRPAALPLQV